MNIHFHTPVDTNMNNIRLVVCLFCESEHLFPQSKKLHYLQHTTQMKLNLVHATPTSAANNKLNRNPLASRPTITSTSG